MLNIQQIEVFKTDVAEATEANKLLQELLHSFPHYRFNFDLEDCDKILRAEGVREQQEKMLIMQLIQASGHSIEILADQ